MEEKLNLEGMSGVKCATCGWEFFGDSSSKECLDCYLKRTGKVLLKIGNELVPVFVN